ncbi:MAG: hypothetical protein KDN22_05250 [Verrucomicrobiae bacterium]|nr:hypothetical protein [Verrucomicrobiae bacterium]
MSILFSVLPLVALLFTVIRWNSPAIRVICVIVILGAAAMGTVGVGVSRFLAERSLNTPPSNEWINGARATESEVHEWLPTLVSSIVALSVIALFNGPREGKSDVPT